MKRGSSSRRDAPARRDPPARRDAPPRRQAAAGRRGVGGEQVEGRQAVRELLIARTRKVHEVWLAEDLDPAPIIDDIVELATGARVPIREVGRRKLEHEAGTDAPQGVLAKAAALPEADLETIAKAKVGGRPPFLVALDGITDPGNLGALFRSAEGAGVTGVVLPRHRAAHVTPAVTKASAGAVEHLPIALVSGLPAALLRLRDLGVWTIGLDGDAERSLFDLPVADQPVAVVLGAEGAGLGRLTKQRCDALVAIPQLGRLSSLNVASAGALACFEVARRRLGAAPS